MSRHNKERSLEWGSVNRSSNKLGIPNRAEGRDGDIQVRQTNLGAKLFGKIGGRWHSTFLSKEQEIIGTSGTKIGMDSSGALSVNQILLTGKITLTESNTNVAIGTGNSTVGTDNIAIGVQAGNDFESGAIKNVVVGNYAGDKISSGDWNVMIGYYAGANPSSGAPTTTGSKNICIGFGAVCDAAGDSDEIVIGEAVKGKGSNTITIGGSDMTDFYCGTDQDLTFRNGAGTVRCGGLAITSTNGVGTDAAAYWYKGAGKVDAGGQPYDLGTAAWAVANDDDAANNLYFEGLYSGTVGVVLTLEQDTGDVTGAFGTYHESSDEGLKQDIVEIPDALNKVNALRGVKFNWKDEEKREERGLQVGVIAQDIEAVLPEAVHTSESTGIKSVLDANQLSGLLIQAVKELSAKLDTMQEEINNLKTE